MIQLEKTDKTLAWGRLFTPEHYVQLAEAGNVVEQMNLAMQLEHRGNVQEAVKWWKRAADEVRTFAVLGLGLATR